MSSITTILFDLGGVIINTKTDKQWLEEDLLPVFQPEKLEKLFLENFFKHFETGKISVDDFIRELKAIARDPSCTDETIISHWNGILQDIPKERIELLKRLKTRYKLILLSNTNDIHRSAIEEYSVKTFGHDVLKENFHSCYFSDQIGHRKPHKETFEWILQKENLSADECLALDDREENLIEPGKLGMLIHHVKTDIVKEFSSTPALSHLS